MDRPTPNSNVRRYLAYISTLGTTQLHLRNPFVIASWSLAFPGLGHSTLFTHRVFTRFHSYICLA